LILEIRTLEGEVFEVEVEDFDVVELNDKLNDSEVNTVVIGNNIFNRFDIKRIVTK